MSTKLGEVFVEFAVKGAEGAKNLAKDMASIPVSAVATVAALTGLSLSFIGLTSDTLEMAQGLREFRAETGESTDELEKWEMVARRVGERNDVVSGSFGRMIQGISRLRTFGDASVAQAFGMLGINDFLNASPDKLMAEIRQRYQGLDRIHRQRFATVAGSIIDPRMMTLFESNLSSPESMARMHPLLGKGGIDTAQEFTKALSELTDTIRVEFIGIFKRIEPNLSTIAKFLAFLAEKAGMSFSNTATVGEYIHQRGFFKSMNEFAAMGLESMGNINDLTRRDLWKPSKQRPLAVTQNFYGDVDKSDIDEGILSLQSTLIHTSRMLGKAGH